VQEKDTNEIHGAILFPQQQQQEEKGMWVGGGGKRPPERLFVGFSRRGPRGSWRPRGTAAHSPCSARRNAAQEDRKEAGPFFTDALSVRLTAGLKLSNKTGRGGGQGHPVKA